MNIRTLFKLYSFPFLIVLLGVCLYAGIIIFAKEQDLLSTKATSTKSDLIVAKSKPNKQSNTESTLKKNTEMKSSTSVATLEQKDQITLDPQPVSKPNPEPEKKQKPQEPTTNINESIKPAYLYAKYRVNIRETPNAQARIISRANIGESLEVLENKEEWVKVRNRFGAEGYVASYLLEQQLEQNGGELYKVIPSSLNVRLKPSAQGVIIGQLSQNARIAIVKFNDEWAKVKLPNGQLGYISIKHIIKIK